MIFRRYSTFQSKKNPADLKKHLLGQHLQVHDLDFEIFDRGELIKIIPHAEIEKHVYTLPITRVKITANGTGSTIKTLSKPRRIDIGGPYMIMIFVIFAIIAAALLYFKGEGTYDSTAYILVGIALVAFIFLWIRLEQGYFDYIRKINKWIKSHV